MVSVCIRSFTLSFGWARFIGAGNFGVERQRV